MTAYYFREDETAVLGAIEAQLPFSEGKYQHLISWNKILFPTIFYHLNFQLPHPNRSVGVSSHKCPFRRPQNDMREQKTAFQAFFYIFLVGCPCWYENKEIKYKLKATVNGFFVLDSQLVHLLLPVKRFARGYSATSFNLMHWKVFCTIFMVQAVL